MIFDGLSKPYERKYENDTLLERRQNENIQMQVEDLKTQVSALTRVVHS